MHRRRIVLALTTTGALLLSGAIRAAGTSAANVTIDNFSFPEQITVAANTKVIWSNRDDIPYTITDAAEPLAFKSPPLDNGDSFSHVFAKAGTYHYFCSLHPHMQGTVVVK